MGEVRLLQNGSTAVSKLSVAIPASVVSDTPHLREKTAKLGAIARASAIFGVNEIILYADDAKRDQEAEMRFCSEILQYLETPQYLRKKVFRLSPTLRFTGILPPLQVPSHNVPRAFSEVKVGDVREGVVASKNGENVIVDVGLEKPIPVLGNKRVGERVTLQLVELGKNPRGELIEASKMSMSEADMRPRYWGYRVHKAKSLGRLLNDGRWDLKLGTSRYGTPVQELLSSLSEDLKNGKSTLVAFGSPKMGLREILAAENLSPKNAFDYYVNTVPDQETMTVRTEEAIFVSLGILNLAAKLTG